MLIIAALGAVICPDYCVLVVTRHQPNPSDIAFVHNRFSVRLSLLLSGFFAHLHAMLCQHVAGAIATLIGLLLVESCSLSNLYRLDIPPCFGRLSSLIPFHLIYLGVD